jgi:hypothetical protein
MWISDAVGVDRWVMKYGSMIEELHAEIDNWRSDYIHLGQELGKIINEQQDIILRLKEENKRLKRENWNLKKMKGRRK